MISEWGKLAFDEFMDSFKLALPSRYMKRFFKDIDFLFRLRELTKDEQKDMDQRQ